MAQNIQRVVTGDTIRLPVTLQINGETFAISGSAEIKAAIVDTSHNFIIAGPVIVQPDADGSDWDNSLVVVVFAPADTSGVTKQGGAFVEIQVNDGGLRTWFVPVTIVRGHVA